MLTFLLGRLCEKTAYRHGGDRRDSCCVYDGALWNLIETGGGDCGDFCVCDAPCVIGDKRVVT